MKYVDWDSVGYAVVVLGVLGMITFSAMSDSSDVKAKAAACTEISKAALAAGKDLPECAKHL